MLRTLLRATLCLYPAFPGVKATPGRYTFVERRFEKAIPASGDIVHLLLHHKTTQVVSSQ
jgi:hypothetical protein